MLNYISNNNCIMKPNLEITRGFFFVAIPTTWSSVIRETH